MDLQSYIQLKEAALQVGKPNELTESVDSSVDSIWEEVEAFAHALVEEEGMDLSDMTWEEVREVYITEVLKGVDGKPLPVSAADKASVAKAKAKRENDAAYVAKANEYKKKNPGVTDMTAYKAGGGGEKASQQGVDRGTGGSSAFRREVQTKAIERQGRDNITNRATNVANQKKAKAASDAKNAKDSKAFMDLMTSKIPKKDNKTTDNKTTDNKTGGGGGGGGNTTTTTQRSSQKAAPAAAPAKDRMAGASKADRMGAWAKANPKLAAAQKQRAATRGTSATTNPLMKDMKSRMPAPKAAAPKADSSQVRAMSKPAPSGAAKAAASTSGPKFNPAASRIAMGGNKVTTKPSAGAKAAMAAGSSTAPKFNPNAPKIKLNNSVEMSEFDVILEHLVAQGFGDDEALKLMVNMSEEKREEILSVMSEGVVDNVEYLNRYGGHPEVKSKKKKKTPFEKENPGHSDSEPTARFTKADREEMLAAKKEIGAKVSAAAEKARGKQKTQKEQDESLYQAYLSMMSEEESDRRKDTHLERGGHAARTDYSKPPATGNDFGKKKMTEAEREEARKKAFSKVAADLKKKHGEGSIKTN